VYSIRFKRNGPGFYWIQIKEGGRWKVAGIIRRDESLWTDGGWLLYARDDQHRDLPAGAEHLPPLLEEETWDTYSEARERALYLING
jgi:hypothetical protein